MKTRIQVVLALALLSLVAVPVLGQIDPALADTKGYTISGNVGVPGVNMRGSPEFMVSDSSGRYVATVPHNWSGALQPEKDGTRFHPSSRSFSSVTENISQMDFDVV